MFAASNITRPAWAVFDAIWYLKTYRPAREACGNDAEAALAYYLQSGAKLGHSPSPLFDERYYLEQNPDIAELIRHGNYRSGFDHFCQYGHRGLSPHWLFDDELYGRLYEDMSLENLDLHGCAGRYDHYLRTGQFERRQVHFLFDAIFYRHQALAAGVTEADINTLGPFVHYLYGLGTIKPELQPSIYFDPTWYVARNFGVNAAIEQGLFKSAIEHYLRNESPMLFDPVPEFSEAFYYEANRDISHAVDNGYFRSAYQHFVQFGAFELRRPHPNIDLVYYRDMNPRVADDLNTGAVRDAFSHLRMIGLPENLVYAPPEAFVHVSEQAAKKLFRSKADDNLVLFARQKLDFTNDNSALSVILVAFNKFELTMLALASLRMNFAGAIQLILIDNGSSDHTRWIDRHIQGAMIVHLPENIGFLRAANLGLVHATAPATLYLNNDIELGFGAVNAALSRLYSSPDIGAIGGKILRAHGKLQEAGSIIWRDGTAVGYMRDAPSLAPEANFVREVDYCSGVFLLCRTDCLKTLGGLDEDFSPAYYEDADLCIRIARLGLRILYDPLVVVHHLEFGSADTSDASMALMKRGHKIFIRKYQSYLETKFEKLPANIVKARSQSKRKKILFIEDTVPLRRLGSGFVRANDVVQAIVAAGYDVSIFPINGTSHDVQSLLADFPDQVEILYDREFTGLPQCLSDRAGYYDLIWVSRTHNLKRILPFCADAGITPDKIPFVLDTEAIVSLREASHAALLAGASSFDVEKKLQEEFSSAGHCAHITAVNPTETALLHRLGFPHVSCLGTIRQPEPTAKPFHDRQGLLFVASIHQSDSPNLDSLYWFRDEVVPWLIQEMDDPPPLNFVGYVAGGVDLSDFSDDPRIKIHGPADDLAPHYNANRVFIAPTRFAAGTPYKLYEAASFGLPCVATELLVRQLGWQSGVELLSAPVADPRRFASQLAMLYRTEALWVKLRAQAIKRLETENRPEPFYAMVKTILEEALSKPKLPQPSPASLKRRPSRKSVPVG